MISSTALSVLALVAPPPRGTALPTAADTLAMSSGRLGATVAAVLGLVGVAVGGLAVARPSRRSGRARGVLALVAGLIATALGGLFVVTADGGVGTGNGLGGAVVALALGLVAVVLGALSVARARRVTAGGRQRI